MIDTKAIEEMYRKVVIGGSPGDIPILSDQEMQILARAYSSLYVCYHTSEALLAAERGGTQNEFQAAMKALEEAMK